MNDLKIIVNLFYFPMEQLKQILRSCVVYVPINGGSGLRNDEWCGKNLFFDDTGDNISSKNKILNEMTSIYWFWKNMLPADQVVKYVGFNHYRRFFDLDEIKDYHDYDLIYAESIYPSNFNLIQQYQIYHNISDLRICFDILKDLDVYFAQDFEYYLMNQYTNFAPCNMFVAKRELFEEWCRFIFPILFKLEERIDLTGRDNYQHRAICFLCERIFGFWCWQRSRYMKTKAAKIIEYSKFKPVGINERGTY